MFIQKILLNNFSRHLEVKTIKLKGVYFPLYNVLKPWQPLCTIAEFFSDHWCSNKDRSPTHFLQQLNSVWDGHSQCVHEHCIALRNLLSGSGQYSIRQTSHRQNGNCSFNNTCELHVPACYTIILFNSFHGVHSQHLSIYYVQYVRVRTCGYNSHGKIIMCSVLYFLLPHSCDKQRCMWGMWRNSQQ